MLKCEDKNYPKKPYSQSRRFDGNILYQYYIINGNSQF